MKLKKPQNSVSLFGKYEVAVLSDQRIILPANLRQQLEGNGMKKLFPGRIPGCKALVLCPENLWGHWIKKLKNKFPCFETQNGARAFLIPWQPIRWDSKGRISLPRRAKYYAGIKVNNTVIVIGIDYYIELWAEEEFVKTTRQCENAIGDSV